MSDILMEPIGTIHTPYIDTAPRQPKPGDTGLFFIELFEEYIEGLMDLKSFRYLYILFYLDRRSGSVSMTARPPFAGGRTVGVFASRSPSRPNHIGLSIVKLKDIKGNKVFISPIDALDNTPLLDIKPYIRNLDIKEDSNSGWADELQT